MKCSILLINYFHCILCSDGDGWFTSILKFFGLVGGSKGSDGGDGAPGYHGGHGAHGQDGRPGHGW